MFVCCAGGVSNRRLLCCSRKWQPVVLNDDAWKESECECVCGRIISCLPPCVLFPTSSKWMLHAESEGMTQNDTMWNVRSPSPPSCPSCSSPWVQNVTLSGCWFVFSVGVDTQTRAALRQQTPLASNMQMRHIIIVVAAAECIREGRTIQPSVSLRLLKRRFFLLYFLNTSQTRVKSHWWSGSFYFHFCIPFFLCIAKQQWIVGQILIFKMFAYT